MQMVLKLQISRCFYAFVLHVVTSFLSQKPPQKEYVCHSHLKKNTKNTPTHAHVPMGHSNCYKLILSRGILKILPLLGTLHSWASTGYVSCEKILSIIFVSICFKASGWTRKAESPCILLYPPTGHKNRHTVDRRGSALSLPNNRWPEKIQQDQANKIQGRQFLSCPTPLMKRKGDYSTP